MFDSDLSFSPDTFCGSARVFPLPNLVMFPGVLQPLRVFESRYREMVEAALADDQLIAMALLEPGWEDEYDGRPPIEPVMCLGKIVTHQRLSDGRYNLLLLGLRRIRLVRELPSVRSFRQAEVELLADDYSDDCDADRDRQQKAVIGAFRDCMPKLNLDQDGLEGLLAKQMPLGVLTDIVSYSLDLSLFQKQQLLAETCVQRRARRLLDYMAELTGDWTAQRDFPPRFSAN
jgi:Lon protease-like protein